jgi:putative addiction module killer protein
MEARPRTIEIYTDTTGWQPFDEWLQSLDPKKAKGVIQNRLHRIAEGNLGDCKRYGPITEFRVHLGPGYRIYAIEDGPLLVILLGGGEKSGQSKDFKTALQCWRDYERRKR